MLYYVYIEKDVFMKLEVKRIGNSDGFILPRELMQRLRYQTRAILPAPTVELPCGGLQLLPCTTPLWRRDNGEAERTEFTDVYCYTLVALGEAIETAAGMG